MTRPTVLILGGFDKHSDFHELFEHFHGSKVKALVVLGATQKIILDTARDTGFLAIATRRARLRTRSHARGRFPDQATRCCFRPPARAGICSITSSSAAGCFKEIVNAF
jgi:hypothetical protein